MLLVLRPAMRPMRHFSSLLWGLGEESQLTHLRVDEDRALLHLEYPLDFRYADLQTLHLSILLWGLDLDQADLLYRVGLTGRVYYNGKLYQSRRPEEARVVAEDTESPQ